MMDIKIKCGNQMWQSNVGKCLYLRSGGLYTLSEMRTHVALKIEIGELVVLVELKKLAKLAVSTDNAAVLRVLKLVLADVGIDLTRHLRARHLSAEWLTEEGSKLLANLRRLHETAGSAVARLALALLACLEGVLQLALRPLLESAHLCRNRSELAAESSKMGEKLRKIIGEGGRRRGSNLDSVGNSLAGNRLAGNSLAGNSLARGLGGLLGLGDLRASGLRFLNHYTLS